MQPKATVFWCFDWSMLDQAHEAFLERKQRETSGGIVLNPMRDIIEFLNSPEAREFKLRTEISALPLAA